MILKYIFVPVIMFVLTFSSGSNALAQSNATTYETALSEVSNVLTSVRHFLSNTLAWATGSYETVGGTQQSTAVTVDFGIVEYFPNLKTKIGFASNAKDPVLSKAVEGADNKLDKIGPGLICSNIEFDLVYKHPDESNAAVTETVNSEGESITSASPSVWFKAYQKSIGDLNVSQLYQLTGAASQYQWPDFSRTEKSVHPIPADPVGNANFMGQWVATANHSYPVLWSFWNEPGHTFMGITRTSDEFGTVLYPNETGAQFDARKIVQAGSSSLIFAKLYTQHETQIRKTMYGNSQFGLASFLAADFNPYKLTPDDSVYFEAVTNTLKNKFPKASIDFITFNNFNGKWPISISGARTVLGNRSDTGSFIVTQYSPGTLKINDNGDITNSDVTPMEVSVAMLTDLAQIERAADVRTMCMSYWVAGNYGFLSDARNGSGLVENERYKAIQLFTQLPTVRTKLDFGVTGLEAKGVHGLAGVNQSKAAVLLWNESAVSVTVPLTLSRVPNSVAGSMTVSTISDTNPTLVTAPYGVGDVVVLPPHGIALIEMKSATIADPLLRRKSISTDTALLKTRFLQTKSTVDRVPFACTDVTKLPNFTTCSKNTGTYGFYDSVRSIAYLGRGEGVTRATVTATYESLPAKLYLNPHIFAQSNVGIGTSSLPVVVTATFPSCQVTVTAKADPAGYQVLDFTSPTVNPFCRNGKTAVLTFAMQGSAVSGTQAEIYVSSSITEAALLAKNNKVISFRATAPDTQERLVVEPSLKAIKEATAE